MGAASSGSGSSAKNITRSPHHDELETTSDAAVRVSRMT